MKIGFIGCGNMAQPIITAVAEKGLFAPENIFVYDILTDKLNDFCTMHSFTALENEIQAAETVDILFLCVKPQGFPALLDKIAVSINKYKPLIVSIAAGKTISSIASYFSNEIKVGRIFPNLNATVRLAFSAYTLSGNTDENDKKLINDICSSFGDAVYLNEDKFSVFGVLSGCAPAYIFMLIDALAKAAEENGIEPSMANSVAAQAFLGSAAFLKSSSSDATELIDRVCSKGGTTIEGVNSLKNDEIYSVIRNAFNSSLARDAQLGS